MTKNQQQNPDPQAKGPFSPLQTGCAFVMLTNMLIYLGVVLFTFNLLDPSKIDASYLAKRGFTARPDPKSEQDVAFQKLSQEKREQQVQAEMLNPSKLGLKKEPSVAMKLSQIEQRRFESSRPEEAERPKAALTASSLRSGSSAIRIAPSRLYSASIYPQATMPGIYSPIRNYSPKPLVLETYETLSVEMASGINFPIFSLPSFDPSGNYLYRPPNPIPEASRGGLKLSSPSAGAESLTNKTEKAAEPPATKPSGKPLVKESP